MPLATTLSDATPNAFVTAEGEDKKVADAPDPGALKVTATPATGLFPVSFTVTAKAFAKAVFIAALCGVLPGLAVIVDGAPTVLVSEKMVDNPTEDALTA